MDSPLLTLGFVIFGITFSIYSGIAKSQPPSRSVSRPSPSPPPPPPPLYTPPPSPPLRPPHSFSPRPRSRHSSSPPNPAHVDPVPKPKTSPANSKHPRHHRSPPRPPSDRMNVGKKIGLLFAGIVGIMQIGVVGFLVFKRRQLLRTKDAFEASA